MNEIGAYGRKFIIMWDFFSKVFDEFIYSFYLSCWTASGKMPMQLPLAGSH